MLSWPVLVKFKWLLDQRNVWVFALTALLVAKTVSPLVRQCQKVLNDISTWQAVGLYWVCGHTGVQGNEIAEKLTRDGSVQKFVGPQPSLGVSWQDIRKKKRWMDNQHLVRWWGPSSTERQAQELVLGTSPGAKTRLLSFNWTQSRIVIGLLTGHNTLRRHLHLKGLANSPLYRRCGAEHETTTNFLCEREALASLVHVHLGSFSLHPRTIRV